MDKTYEVATPLEETIGQGIGSDRDGPFTTTLEAKEANKIDYAWRSLEDSKAITVPLGSKRSAFNPDKNYYCEIESFAESIGFHMSQSNGVYTLRPTAPNPTSHLNEIEQFKKDYPEYRFMKGTQARGNGANGIPKNYTGTCETIELKDGFRKRRMLEWLHTAKLNVEFCNMLRYLKRNHYRKLTDEIITRKNKEFTTTFVSAAKELGYLQASFNKKHKICYQLTEKGKKYVNNI